MEVSYCHPLKARIFSYCHPLKARIFCSSLHIPKSQYYSIPPQPIPTQKLCTHLRRPKWRSLVALGCAKVGPATEVERELEEEMKNSGGNEKWVRWMEKCSSGGGGGIAELMECLEREAIMGEDEGRDPTDYNRRAHVFDRSSRVFQALKERTHSY